MRFKLLKSRVHPYALVLFITCLQFTGLTAQVNPCYVNGIVQNSFNEPIPNVSVIIKNLKNNFTSGTTTDSSGKFSFSKISSGGPYSFTFSMIGYEGQVLSGYNIKANATLSLMVKLNQSAGTALDQVVVVGYGSQKRKDLTGSVSSIGAKELKEGTVTRVEQALLGKVAGVQVKTVSGQPGASPQIRIRGVGSISAGVDPLYVVDGFPIGDLQTLNPNDIESVDILKDASATAIYGSRGSNGVIIINTKRGKAGKTQYSFDTYTGVQRYLTKPVFMNSMEQAHYFYDGIKNRNIDAGNDVSGNAVTDWVIKVPIEVVDVLEGRQTINTDWLGAVLRTAPQQQYQLSASGGSENVKFALSGEYLDQDGIIINTGFKRYSMRSNIDARLSKRLVVRMNVNPSFTSENDVTATGTYGGESVIGDATAINPWFPVYNPDGSYFVMNGLPNGGSFSNAVASAKEIKNKMTGVRLLGNANAEYTIMDGLKFNVLVGFNSQTTSRSKFKPKLPALLNTIAYGEDWSTSDLNWLTEYTLNYSTSIKKHNISALGGYTAQKDNYHSNYIRSDLFPNNLVPTLSAASGQITNGTSLEGSWSMLSYLARVNYNYDSKYYLTASIRTDGSSRFGSQNKYGVFPSAAVAWRISKEDFLKDASFLTELKLRASYGETGNNNIGDFEQYATILYENYPLGGVAAGGYAQEKIANPTLTWEKQKQLNTGFDLSLFKGRVQFTVDYFNSTNSDLLLNVNVPSVTGYTTSLQNIGKVKNTGWEFSASTKNLEGKLQWSTDFNISTYKNRVLQLGPGGDPIYSGANVTQIGQPVGMFYGWLADGIFMNQAQLDKGPIFSPGTSVSSRLGDIRFKDISGPNGKPDGLITSADRTIMGSPYPDFYYGMTNRLSYGNFTFSFSLQGSQGNDIVNLIRYGSYARARTRQAAISVNYWKSEAEPGDGGRFSFRPNDAPTGNVRGTYSDLQVFNGSYLRINNISLGYSVPAAVCQKIRLSSLRFYVNATNPFISTSYPFWNPDNSNSGNALEPGRDNNEYPTTKSIFFGLNIGF